MSDESSRAELTPEEFLRRIRAPLEPAERDEALALFRWFARAYPTPKDRLAYARRKYAEWTRYSGTRAAT